MVTALALAACDEEPPASPPSTPPVPERPEPPEELERPEPATSPSASKLELRSERAVVRKVCRAYDEIAGEGAQDDVLLQTTALRAVREHDVTEAQLAELGARPAEVLESIRARGPPPVCQEFVDKLEDLVRDAG